MGNPSIRQHSHPSPPLTPLSLSVVFYWQCKIASHILVCNFDFYELRNVPVLCLTCLTLLLNTTPQIWFDTVKPLYLTCSKHKIGDLLAFTPVHSNSLIARYHTSFILQLKKNIRSCLNAANDKGATSIAFPTIGCGRLGYPADDVAQAFLDEHLQFRKDTPNTSLKV